MSVQPLSQEQIAKALKTLPGWQYQENKLVRTFTFKDFREAISFIVRLAFYAEEHQHHPELYNVYTGHRGYFVGMKKR